jgi:16S rRNA G1207 methylase RsmC
VVRVSEPTSHYFSAEPTEPLGPSDLRQLNLRIAGHESTVVTAPGVFSAHRLDLGTAVLLRTVAGEDHELPAHGTLVDLGCGWGPLALTMARLAPEAEVWAIDVNPRALELVQLNAARLGLSNIHPATPEEAADVRPDVIWSNPPIRVGKEVLHGLLETWLGRLTPEGHADLVVQRNLGSDSLQKWLTDQAGFPTERLASAKGYRVLRALPSGIDS